MKKTPLYFLLILPVILVFPLFVFAALPVEPTATLTASPNPVNLQSDSIISGITTLTWDSTFTDSCWVTEGGDSGFDTRGATSGSDASTALSVATTFSISCTGFGGTAAASVVVGVEGGGNDIPPTATLSASPSTVDSGDYTTLTWSSTDATSCSVTQGSGSGFTISNDATSGSDVSSNLWNTTTFAIQCTGDGGSAAASKTVTVTSGDDDDDPPSDGDDDDDDDDDDSGGGGGSSKEELIKTILMKLISVLQQLIALVIAQQGE